MAENSDYIQEEKVEETDGGNLRCCLSPTPKMSYGKLISKLLKKFALRIERHEKHVARLARQKKQRQSQQQPTGMKRGLTTGL
jgi:hypothetical protein